MKSKLSLGSLIKKVAFYWIFWACFENLSVRFLFNTFTIFLSWIYFIHIWNCLCYILIFFAIFYLFFLPKRVFWFFLVQLWKFIASSLLTRYEKKILCIFICPLTASVSILIHLAEYKIIQNRLFKTRPTLNLRYLEQG